MKPRKLSGEHRTDWPEPLLREYARHYLGVQRINAGLLEALRCVLGNLEHADALRAQLELNTRVGFATERTMRTLLGQLAKASITYQRSVGLSAGKVQTVSFYGRRRGWSSLDEHCRTHEALEDAARDRALTTDQGQQVAAGFNARQAALGIRPEDVPY